MTDSKVNTIVLTKDAYDRIKGENMRCRILLDSILKHIEFAGEGSGDLKLDEQKILSTIEVCYPDSYNQKVSQLKRKQAVEREKAISREVQNNAYFILQTRLAQTGKQLKIGNTTDNR